jgi:TonB family protein
MKRYIGTALFALVISLMTGASLYAQGGSPQDPVEQENRRRELERFNNLLARAREAVRAPGQRSADPGANNWLQAPGQRSANPAIAGVRLYERDATNALNGAWWTNTALVNRLGLTDDQKARIERAYENHRQRIALSTAQLEKEEAQLARLLEAETVDRNAVLSQIDRVTQARGDMERSNSAMTLEMREVLTRAQWMQLQPSQRVRVGAGVLAANLASQVEPVYPELARQAQVQGVVVLEVEISKEGSVENVRVINGHPLLTQAAVDAVKQWRYRPTLLNGVPMPVVSTINVNFPFVAGAGTPFGQRTGGPVGVGGRGGGGRGTPDGVGGAGGRGQRQQ